MQACTAVDLNTHQVQGCMPEPGLLTYMLLQNEPEFKQMQRLLDVKGRRSQNWERSAQDKVGKAGLEEFKALQADCDDTELAIRYDMHAKLMHVSLPLPSPPLPSPASACYNLMHLPKRSRQCSVPCSIMYHGKKCFSAMYSMSLRATLISKRECWQGKVHLRVACPPKHSTCNWVLCSAV